MRKIKNRGAGKASPLLAIDLSGEVVRAVAGRESEGTAVTFEMAQSARVSSANENDVIQFLHRVFKELGAKKKTVTIVLPSKLTITKNVDIPSKDHDEIRKIIDLQSGRFTPYSREEIVIDYFCMETPEQHYTNVLLVIVNRKPIERYYSIMGKCGIQIDNIVIASEAIGRTYLKAGSGNSSQLAVAGVFIDEDASDFTIADRDQLTFVRSIPVGRQQFEQDAEAAQKSLLDELNKSTASYKDQGVGRTIGVLFLVGMVQNLSGFGAVIKESIPYIALNQVSVTVLQESSLFNFSASLKEGLAANQKTSFFDLMSGITELKRLKIDLVPSEVKMRYKVREGGKDIIKLGVLLMTSLLLFSLFLVTKIYLKNGQIKSLDGLNERTSGESRKLEQKSTKSRALRDLLASRGKGLLVFEKINSLIGDDIYLTSFTYEKDGHITFTGTAESMSRAFAFVTELEESNFFKEVKAKDTKSRREGQKEVADFEIETIFSEEV